MNKKNLLIAGCLANLLVLSQAWAAECTVRAQTLEFGAIKASEHRSEAIGALTVFCKGNPGEHVTYDLALNRGVGDFNERRMKESAPA